MKKNILANFIGRFWGLLSNFLFIPLYIKYLGFESYSIISFTLLIAGVMAILDAGLTATLSREFARKDITHQEKIRTFKTLELTYLFVTLVCISFLFLFSGFLASKWLNLESFTPTQVSFFIKIISFDIGFQLLFRFYSGGLLGLEKQVKANLYQVAWGILRNGLVVLVIIFYPNLGVFFSWQAISTIIFTLLLKLSLQKELIGNYSFSFSTRIETSVFKKVWTFAGGMLLIAIVAAFNTQMDKIVITKLLSLKSLGYYTIAISLSQILVVIVSPISIALLPKFTAQYSQEKSNDAALLYSKTSLIVSIFVFGIMCNMAFFAKELIWVWTGSTDIALKASIFLPVVSFSMAMLALATLPYQLAIANGYTKLNNILGISSLIITIPGYFLATKKFGALGAASVFCIVQTITTLVYLYFINKKFIKVRIITDIYLKQIFIPLIISIVTVYIFSFIPNIGKDNRIFTIIWIGISTLCTFLVLFVFLFPIKEIKSWTNFNKIKFPTK